MMRPPGNTVTINKGKHQLTREAKTVPPGGSIMYYIILIRAKVIIGLVGAKYSLGDNRTVE